MNVMAIALVLLMAVAVSAAMGLVTWGLVLEARSKPGVAQSGTRPVREYASGMADSAGDPVVGATLAGYTI